MKNKRDMSYIMEGIEAISGIAEQIKEAHRHLSPLAKQLKEISDKWQENLKQLNIALQSIIQSQKSFQDFAEKVARVSKFGRETILETGWWFTPSLMDFLMEIPAELILEVLNNYADGKKSAITNLFKKVYHQNNYQYLKRTTKNWDENLLFKQRMKVIKDALEAHCRGKYTLSVPTLLPIAEGIATEYCKKVKIYDRNDRSKGGDKIKKAIKHKKKLGKLFPLDFLFNAIDGIVFKDTDQLKREKLHYERLLNRHAVLHGIQKNYATPKNSLQCFMLLDVLSLLEV